MQLITTSGPAVSSNRSSCCGFSISSTTVRREEYSGAKSPRAASCRIVPTTRRSGAFDKPRNTALPKRPVAPRTRSFTALPVRELWHASCRVELVKQLLALLDTRVIDQHRAIDALENEQAARSGP